MQDEIKRERPKGRPTKAAAKSNKNFAVINKCKICKSPYKDEITLELLKGEEYHEDIRKRFNDLPYFADAPLNASNVSAHWGHSNPEEMAKSDHMAVVKAISTKPMEYSSEVVSLYQTKYDDTLNKLKMVDEIHKQRLRNLWELQRNLEEIKEKPLPEGALERSPIDEARIQELTLAIDDTLNKLADSMLKHMKTEQGPAKNINIIFIKEVKTGIEQFVASMMDVIVEEIDNPMVQSRIKEKFIEKLDQSVAPIIDKAVPTDYEVVE